MSLGPKDLEQTGAKPKAKMARSQAGLRLVRDRCSETQSIIMATKDYVRTLWPLALHQARPEAKQMPKVQRVKL